MIIDAKEVRSKSNLKDVESENMSIDEEGLAHIIRVVTDLYADPDSACLREYSANGLDSHVEAGQTRPIEITLPTNANPTLIFQDWGMGLSKHGLANYYAKYGASTKRKSNKFIGALGLGCKSALSMTPSFTITAVKDGQKIVAILHRGEDGVGKIEYVMEIETDEPNGVKVAIPVSDNINEYKAKAKAIFITWDRGTVLVDGKEPDLSITSDTDFVKLGKAGYLSRNGVESSRFGYSRNGSIIVNMGGIGYPVDGKQMEILMNNIKDDQFPLSMRSTLASIKSAIRNNLTLVVNVDLGDVDLVPSRESVRWTRKSFDAVTLRMKDAILALPNALADDFKDCKSHVEVLAKNVLGFAESFRAIYKQVQWQGKNLPTNVQLYLTTQDNYYDEGIENFVLRYDANGDRMPALKSDRAQYFSFGFETSLARSFSTGTTEVTQSWVFVKIDEAQDVRKKISPFANSFVQDLRVTGDLKAGDSLRIVAYKGDLLDNEWLKAVYKSSDRFFSVTLDEIKDRAKSRRKINASQAAVGRVSNPKDAVERTTLTYGVTIVNKDGVITNDRMSTKAIDEFAAENKAQVYVDNNDLIRNDGYSGAWNNISVFAPVNSVIVSVGQGRKAEALEKRLSSPLGNLQNDITKNVNAFVKTITVEDYFHSSSPHSLLSDSDISAYLEEGFLKRITTGENAVSQKLRGLSHSGYNRLTPENKKWTEKFEATRKELVEMCVLVFGARREYTTNRDVYNKAIGAYLNGLKAEIEAVVSKA